MLNNAVTYYSRKTIDDVIIATSNISHEINYQKSHQVSFAIGYNISIETATIHQLSFHKNQV